MRAPHASKSPEERGKVDDLFDCLMSFSGFIKHLRERKGPAAVGRFFKSNGSRRTVESQGSSSSGTVASSPDRHVDQRSVLAKVSVEGVDMEVRVHAETLVSAVLVKCRLDIGTLICCNGRVLVGSEEMRTLVEEDGTVRLNQVIDISSSGSDSEFEVGGAGGHDDALVFSPPPKRQAVVPETPNASSQGSSGRSRAPRYFGVSPAATSTIQGFMELETKTRNYSVRQSAVLEINGLSPTRAHSWNGTARQLLQMLVDLDIVGEGQGLGMKHLADHDSAEQMAYLLLESEELGYAPKTRLNKLNNYVGILKFMAKEWDKMAGYYYQNVNRSWLNASIAIVEDARDMARRRYMAAGGGKHFIEQWVEKGIWMDLEQWKGFVKMVKEEAATLGNALERGHPSPGQLEKFAGVVLVLLAVTSGPQRTQVYVSMRTQDITDTGSTIYIKIRWEKNTLKQFERAAAAGAVGTMRILPVVDDDCQKALRLWIKYRRQIAVSDFLFISREGQGLKDNGKVACMVKSVTFPLAKRPLTMLNLRHLKCTHFVSAVNAHPTLTVAQKQELLRSHASWMGHTADTMVEFYVIRGSTQSAETDAVTMRRAQLHIGV